MQTGALTWIRCRRLFAARITVVANLLIARVVTAQVPFAWDTGAALTTAERAYVATRIYADVEVYFAHWQALPGYDLSGRYQRYLVEALSAPDRRAFDLATVAFLASLHNGHTGFVDQWLVRRYGQPIGFFAVREESGWVVNHSAVPGLHPGDVITGIDDDSLEAFFKQREPYLFGSSSRWRARALFESPYLFPQRFTLYLADGRRVIVDRATQHPFPRDSVTTGKNFPGGVVYIRIPGFGESHFEDSALAWVRRSHAAPGLIIDVRENHGGSTPSRLIGALMNKPWRWFVETTPMSVSLFRYYRSRAGGRGLSEYDRGYYDAFDEYFASPQFQTIPPVTPPDSDAYAGRIVLLVDGGCFSACEDFLVAFKSSHRALIVGDTTGGSSGQPTYEAFPNGMGYSIGAKRASMPDGSPFEGVGFGPDVRVEPTSADYRQGVDPVLAEALKRLTAHGPP